MSVCCSARNTKLFITGLIDGGRGHEPRNVGPSRHWERQENEFSPRAFREKHVAAHTMSLAQRPIFGLLTSRIHY